ENIEQHRSDANPNVQRFLGTQGDLGQQLGIDNAWAFAIVRQVGNYAEVFQRNITPLGIERGPNRLWRDGGLLYSPPFRCAGRRSPARAARVIAPAPPRA